MSHEVIWVECALGKFGWGAEGHCRSREDGVRDGHSDYTISESVLRKSTG